MVSYIAADVIYDHLTTTSAYLGGDSVDTLGYWR